MGFYFNDTLTVVVAFDQFTTSGMDYADVEQQNYLKDRIYYNQKVFRTISMVPSGKIQERPTVVRIDATQLKPDELVDDVAYAPWSQQQPFQTTTP